MRPSKGATPCASVEAPWTPAPLIPGSNPTVRAAGAAARAKASNGWGGSLPSCVGGGGAHCCRASSIAHYRLYTMPNAGSSLVCGQGEWRAKSGPSMFKIDSTRKGFCDWRHPRPQTLRSLCGERPKVLCAKCFAFFVLGVRHNYPR